MVLEVHDFWRLEELIGSTVSVKGSLVRTRTADNVELGGFLAEPTQVDNGWVVLHFHGMYENFHLALFVDELARQLTEAGTSFITANTRAQDYHVELRKWEEGSIKNFSWAVFGGAYEIFSDCLIDIRGWISFCRTVLKKKVILMGHSHGALKAAYYAAMANDENVPEAVVLISPSDDTGAQKASLGPRYTEALTLAEQWVADGREYEILPEWLYGDRISARMYVDMFRPKSDLAIFTFTDPSNANGISGRLSQPTLMIMGEGDVATAGVDSQRALAIGEELLSNANSFAGYVIKNANHHYLGEEKELARRIVVWARETFPTVFLSQQ